jgi:signal transduction histidine kinase
MSKVPPHLHELLGELVQLLFDFIGLHGSEDYKVVITGANADGGHIISAVGMLPQLIAQLAEPAQLWTPNGDVVATNQRFNELLGLSADMDWGAEGRRFIDDPQLSVAGARDLALKALGGAPVEIASLPYTPPMIGSNGAHPPESLRLFIRLRPLKDDDGKVEYVLCTVTEFATVSERLENDLMRSQKMENVETLASSVAHEFNNLFTGIRGLTELICDAVDKDSEIAEFAGLISKNITRGAELIQKLSSFAREMPHSLRRTKMSAYLKHVLPLIQLQVPKRLEIQLEVLADAPVMLDPNRLDQAMANLISNAKDATNGSGKIKLTLRQGTPLRADDIDLDWIELDVEDSGPGIPETLYEKVIDPFFTTKDRGKSTGLGLSMTQRIIALHDGVIEIGRSDTLGGACFRIYLPVAKD